MSEATSSCVDEKEFEALLGCCGSELSELESKKYTMRTEVDRTQQMVERWSSVPRSSRSLRNALFGKRRDLEITMQSCKQAAYRRDVETNSIKKGRIGRSMDRGNTTGPHGFAEQHGKCSRDSANSNIL